MLHTVRLNADNRNPSVNWVTNLNRSAKGNTMIVVVPATGVFFQFQPENREQNGNVPVKQ